MPIDTEARSTSLLRGTLDIHMHTAPDIYPRSVTVPEAANQAKAAGMGAILVKSHCTDTSDRAELTRRLTGFPVYGGVTLNYSVGGLNVHAVREAIRQGGLDAQHQRPMLPAACRHHSLSGGSPAGGSGRDYSPSGKRPARPMLFVQKVLAPGPQRKHPGKGKLWESPGRAEG
jgi:Family of unknown function (DUF6282)